MPDLVGKRLLVAGFLCLFGCLPGGGHRAAAADAIDGSASFATCRPALSGEVILNEVMVRPGGLDLDGDGKSNGRDEALELVLDSDADADLSGATLWVDGLLRGTVLQAPCLSSGMLVVLTGAETAPLALPAGAVQIALDHSLGLADGGGSIELRGRLGTVLGALEYPAEAGGPPSSRTRAVDGQRDAPLVPHRSLPAADGAPWSIGRCATGLAPCTCIAAQKALCDMGQ